MEQTEAQRMHRELQAELAEAEQRARGLRQLVEGFETLFPSFRADSAPRPSAPPAPPASAADRLKGRAAVESVLRENGGWMTVVEVTKDLVRRGWAPEIANPEPSVRTTLRRLLSSGLAERRNNGTLAYRLRATGDENDPADTGSFSNSPEGGDASEDDHRADHHRAVALT